MSKGVIGTIIIVVILLIIGGIMFFNKKQDDTSVAEITPVVTITSTSAPASTNTSAAMPTTESATSEYTVRYTDSGYSPDTIEVPAGSTVKFISESSNPMWTASDPHPVHTNFSAFDARKSYKKGETYSFTFDKAGTYKYHNHNVPGDGGTVVVK